MSISNVLNNTGNTTKLLSSFSALDVAQQKVLLSSKLLTEEQKKMCATMATLSSANVKYTAEQLAKTTGVSTETLANWGLIKSTDTLTISELAEKAASDAQAKSVLEKVIAQNAQDVANGKVTASNVALSASETYATYATGAFTTAIKGNIKAMWTWMTTTPIGWITMFVGSILTAVTAYNALTDSVEETKEKSEELISTYNDALNTANSHKQSIDNIADRYEELAKGVNNLGENISLTSEEYQEYNSIVNDIAEMFPTMVQGYTEEGNAILKLKGNVDALREAYEAETQAAYNSLVSTGKDADGNDILKNANNVITGSTLGAHDWGNAEKIKYLDKLMEATDSVDDMLSLWDESLDNGYRNWFEDFAGVGGIVNIEKLSDKDLANIRKNAKVLKQQYKAEIDSAVDDAEILANAYLMTNEDYTKLDEQSKNAASIMVNSLNAGIVSRFGENKEKVGEYVNDIIQTILTNSDARKAMIDLFTMDTSDMSISEIESDVNSYINTIAGILQEDPIELKARLGFDGSDTEPLVNKVKGFLKDEFDDKVGELTLEELDIASGLDIDDTTLLSWDELIAKIREVQGSTLDNESGNLSFEESISQVQSLSKGLDELAKVYADVKDGEGFDFSSILNNEDFKTLFGSYTEEYENFIKTVSESPEDINACQSAFNDLASAYIYGQDVLKNVTDETLDSTVAILKQMGVTNAEEVATDALTRAKADLAAQEWLNTQTKYDLVNATNEDIVGLLKEAQSAEIDSVAIAELVANEIMLNNNDLDVSQKLNALAQVAHYANLAGAEIEALNAAMSGGGKTKKAFAEENGIEVISVKNRTDGETNLGWQYKYNGTLYENLDEAYLAQQYDSLKEQFNKPVNIDLPTVSFDGTSGNYSDSSSKKEFEETIDFFEEKINNLNDAISLLDANVNNVTGSFAKNTLIGEQINLNAQKINDYSSALAMYSQKANESLASIPMDLWDKVINGAVDISTFVGEGNEAVVDAIKEYQKWSDKVAECNQQLAELQETIAQLSLTKFKNVAQDFTDQFDIRDSVKSNIDAYISLMEESGELVGESFYSSLIEQSQKQLITLEKEKVALSNELTSSLMSGTIKQGSDEWLEMVNILTELDGQIIDCKASIEEFSNSILEIDTKIFERIQDQFSNISSELENIVELMSNYDLVTDGGEFTNKGLVSLGTLAQQYELAQYQLSQYQNEIDELNKAYSEGKYSTIEYSERLAELVSGQWDCVDSIESVKDAMLDLHEQRIDKAIEGIEKEKDAYKELIDAQIESLNKEKDLHDYKKSLSEKSDEAEKIERQIALLELDDSAKANAQKAKLREELAKIRGEIEEMEYDHSIETQTDALNKQYEDFESEKDAEIEKLEESLNDRERLIADSLETVKQNSTIIGQEIANIANKHGVTISNAIVSSWQSGENAIASYGVVLSTQTSGFIAQLIGVENEVYTLQSQANNTANSLVGMFSTRADSLVDELVSSYNSINNANVMTNALRNSLVNTLESGYNVSGITSALNSVASSAMNAKAAIDSLNSTPTTPQVTEKGYSMNQNAQTGYYEIIDNTTGGVVSTHRTQKAAENAYAKLPQYASGTRNAKGGLSITDEDGYELKLPKLANGNYTLVGDGDQILTKVETDNIFDWAKYNPVDFVPQFSLPSMKLTEMVQKSTQPTVNVHYDKLIEFSGNVNDMNQISNTLGSMIKKANDQSWKDFSWECKKLGAW